MVKFISYAGKSFKRCKKKLCNMNEKNVTVKDHSGKDQRSPFV